jgi:hypothetical protein
VPVPVAAGLRRRSAGFGFKFQGGQVYLSVVSVLCCQVRGLCDDPITRPTDYGASLCVI